MPAPAVLTVTEFTPARLSLTPRDVAALLPYAERAHLTIVPTGTADIYVVKPAQVVGVIPLPDARTLYIQPKVPIYSLFLLLQIAYSTADLQSAQVPHNTIDQLIDGVIDSFLTLAEKLLRGGLLRGIEAVTTEGTTIRGRLNLPQSLRRPATLIHQGEAPDATVDIAENRLLKLACDVLTSARQHYQRVRWLLDQLNEVAHDPKANERTITPTPRNAHYMPALELAHLIVEGRYAGGKPGTKLFSSFLIDMNALFERYVTALLRTIPEVTVAAQATLPLDQQARIKVRPDAILTNTSGSRLPVDAKYKLDTPNEDIYQAIAYCHALHSRAALLIYPQPTPKIAEAAPIPLLQLTLDDKTVIHVLSLDLSSGDTIRQHPATLRGAVNSLAWSVQHDG